MTSPAERDPEHQDDPSTGGQTAGQGPVPAEPEDVPDAGEGRLGPQPGGDRLEEESD
ncbi:hypothetical protein HMPREF0063_11224 [Aeromicrobium marinum DSM 15272]|uniref:Uncharacterized protein n=1 Tax=Aeromicrobium marinum DSM 15272 TaxID=585531 RepID=E2SB15_9ACTN|nr:hypothetical protein [Aeromicrobium marinum]EFQ83561.1 hypothetical protein HMPREF0063_11224 [Aeromicrobium marinum DSM 15272]